MDRRGFITMMAGGILATPLAGKAQPTGKVYRIGYLTVPSRETAQGVANTFQLALTDLGWIEGKSIVIDYRFADSRLERLPISRPDSWGSEWISLLPEQTRR
jgi:putative tryptophan/tyrosine transport system substrate-binding protein